MRSRSRTPVRFFDPALKTVSHYIGDPLARIHGHRGNNASQLIVEVWLKAAKRQSSIDLAAEVTGFFVRCTGFARFMGVYQGRHFGPP